MKSLLTLLLLVLTFSLAAQNNYDNIITDDKRVEILLNKVIAAQASAEERNELHNAAVSIQDNGQKLDAADRNFKKSFAATDKAIEIFNALGDTLDVANNRKFKGYLWGRLGKFALAKKETQLAIDLFKSKSMFAAVAISQFDLSRMFEFENKTDSAIYYASIAADYWKQKDADLRVVIANNMLVNLFLKKDLPEKAMQIQQASGQLINKPGMHWQAIVDFYYTSMLLYRRINDDATANKYLQFYADKVTALRSEGIAAKSYYEADRQ